MKKLIPLIVAMITLSITVQAQHVPMAPVIEKAVAGTQCGCHIKTIY